MRVYYIAYGSNLDKSFLKSICPSAFLVKTLEIRDFALMFRGDGNCYAYLTPEKRDGAYFPVAIFSISEEDMHALDIRESYPYLYDKQLFDIEVGGVIVKGIIYVMKDNYEYCMPSTDYMISCSKGYKSLGFDVNILINAILDTDLKMKEGKQKK